MFQALVAAKIRGVAKALKLLFSTPRFPRRKGPLPRPISTTSVVVRAVRRWGAIRVATARAWSESGLSTHAVASDERELKRTKRRNACTPWARTVGRHAWWPALRHSPSAPGASSAALNPYEVGVCQAQKICGENFESSTLITFGALSSRLAVAKYTNLAQVPINIGVSPGASLPAEVLCHSRTLDLQPCLGIMITKQCPTDRRS